MFQALIVDDYEMNIEILEAYLKRTKLFLNIFKSANAKDALDILHKETIDIALLDVMLPDVSGIELCRLIKKEDPNIPVILVTALKERQSLHEGLKAEADEYLTKPVDAGELNLRVKNLLTIRRLHLEQKERYQKLQEELKMAQKLQRSFLPKETPSYQNLQIESLYRPCGFIGGDFYDYLPSEKGFGIFIADVKGKGVASAMITAAVKDNLHKLRDLWEQPEVLLGELNQALAEFFAHGMDDYFVTAFYAIVNAAKETIIYSNAGHCPPLLLNGEIKELDTKKGFPLGMFAHCEYELRTENFPLQSQLFCYTDGIFSLKLGAKSHDDLISMRELLEELWPQGYGIEQLEQTKQMICQSSAENLTDDVNYIALINKGGRKNG